MTTNFIVRRYAVEVPSGATEEGECMTLCDECMEEYATDYARNGDPLRGEIEWDTGETATLDWIEDKDDPEESCEECGESQWDHEEDEPEEGDYVIDCASNGVSIMGERFLGYYPSDQQLRFIREHMRQESYYPSVWQLSDHGNWHLVTSLED